MTIPTTMMPAYPAPAEWEIRRDRNTLVSDSISKIRQTRSHGGERYEIDLTYSPMAKSEFLELAGFLEEVEGRADTFGVILPPLVSMSSIVGSHQLAVTHNKSYRIKGVNAEPTEIVTTWADATTKDTNTVSMTSGDEVTVSMYISDLAATASYCHIRRDSDDGLIDTSPVLQKGYNVFTLTSDETTDVYFSTSILNTVDEWYVRSHKAISDCTIAPTAIDSGDNLHMSAWPLFVCSLEDDIHKVRYGRDGFVRLGFTLIERIST